MHGPESDVQRHLELNISRARVVMSLATLLSIWIDAPVPGSTPWSRWVGPASDGTRWTLAALGLHLAYAVAVLRLTRRRPFTGRMAILTIIADLWFAGIVAVFTEGPTSRSLIFFEFAVVASACRGGLRETVAVTLCGVAVYFEVVLLSWNVSAVYTMRTFYLAIVGYLIGFLGQQRYDTASRIHALEKQADRVRIARSLHDGCIQALAAVNLRLATCRELLAAGRAEAGLAEIDRLRAGVAREYDEARGWVRSLVRLRDESKRNGASDPWFEVRCSFRARGAVTEQILQVVLEAVRNTVQHAGARAATVSAHEANGAVHLSIDDDGVGFPEGSEPPWSIASRIAELGGKIRTGPSAPAGARVDIEFPAA